MPHYRHYRLTHLCMTFTYISYIIIIDYYYTRVSTERAVVSQYWCLGYIIWGLKLFIFCFVFCFIAQFRVSQFFHRVKFTSK